MYPNWPTTLQPFIRRSFLSSAEFNRAILLEINPVAMLCISLTQSMNSGISLSSRGTDLCHGLGRLFSTILQLDTLEWNSIAKIAILFGSHSATVMLQKLVIFGGRKTATYLNDLHILDLGTNLILSSVLKFNFAAILIHVVFFFGLWLVQVTWSTQLSSLETCRHCREGEFRIIQPFKNISQM